MNITNDQYYMQRCINLAQKGLGKTYPNPMVGSVIVNENKIIGEGWHKKSGQPHAEVNAINSVSDKSLLRKSTLYVNLEPCVHFGKTPPCVDIIKQYMIPRVVIGSIDPNPKVAGNGIKSLEQTDCKVTLGVLKKETDFLNRRFFTFHKKKRPYLILKWAQSSDQFIAPLKNEFSKGSVYWITNKKSRQKVHQWRSQESAILVGAQTIIDDNPELTTRDYKGSDPLRLILDPQNRTPKNSKVHSDKRNTYFFNKLKSSSNDLKKMVKLEPFNLKTFLDYCFYKEIQSIIIEGGKITLQHFIDANLWDEARVFEASKKINKGVSIPKLDALSQKTINIGNDKLSFFFN